MKFGISFLNLHPKGFAPLTEAAEELGFESVWLSDHLVFPVDLGRTPYPGAEADSPGEVVRKTPSMWNRPSASLTVSTKPKGRQTPPAHVPTTVTPATGAPAASTTRPRINAAAARVSGGTS